MESDYIKAGKIAADAIEFGKSLIKKDVLLLDVANAVEDRIFKNGGKLAFPINMSINNMAAHSAALPNDKTKFNENDVVKLDIGVHINGCIADTAITVDLSGKNKELVLASREALVAALRLVKPGVEVREIGRVIHDKITSYGFSPIKNLSGHLLKEYKVHGELTIPNYDNVDNTSLKEGMIVAIEPFATTGEGIVVEGKPSSIFRLEHKKPTRDANARKAIEFIENEFKTLPFSKRNLNIPMRYFVLNLLEKEGIIYQYPQLVERSKGLVSQAEHTVIVKEKPIVTTRIN